MGAPPPPFLRPYLEREEKPTEVATSVLLKWLLGLLKPMKRKLALLLILTFASLGVQMATPYLGKLILDEGIMKANMEALGFLVLLLILASASNWALNISRRYLTGLLNQKLLYELRTLVFRHIGDMDVPSVLNKPTGRMVSLVTNDIPAIGDVVTSGSIDMLTNSLTIAGALYVMLSISLHLTLAVLAILPIMAFIALFFARKTREAFREMRSKISQLTSNVEQSVSGARVSQAFTERRSLDLRSFERVSGETMRARIRATIMFAAVNPSLNVVRAISYAILIGYGGSLIASGQLTIGSLIAFYGYTDMFFSPVFMMMMFYNTIQSALAAAERIYSFLKAKPTVTEREGAEDIKIAKGEIILENLSFGYDGNEVFKDLSLRIRPKEILAVVGPTGAGKTTFANLIQRLYDPKEGRILIDGRDLRDFTLRSLRSQIALVPQEPILFNDTVLENIRLGSPGARDEDVEAIVKALGLERLMEGLPHGLKTLVSPGGGNLSVGQRQLISFARAMLKDPRILILDEATSSLDSFTEVVIQEALKKLMQGRTCIVIAHRLSTVKFADRIVVLDNGRIVEEGRHEELLRNGGLYARLYETQMGTSSPLPLKLGKAS
jgi:ABC-type multidrug transport system fused ATPase/permease subunit